VQNSVVLALTAQERTIDSIFALLDFPIGFVNYARLML
jgi:hypothetical protein